MLELPQLMRTGNDMQRAVAEVCVNDVVQNPHRPLVAMLKISRVLMQMLRVPTDWLLIEALAIPK